MFIPLGQPFSYDCIYRLNMDFFVPYIPIYTVLVYMALVAVRLPLLALIIHIVTWVIYGGALVLGVLLTM